MNNFLSVSKEFPQEFAQEFNLFQEDSIIKEPVVILDIDGVVCNSEARIKKSYYRAAMRAGDFSCLNDFHLTVEGDTPIPAGVLLAQTLFERVGVHWVTARDNRAKFLTLQWLRENVLEQTRSSNLWMCDYSSCQSRATAEDFKREVAVDLSQRFQIVAAFDDTPEICQMYYSLGIPAFQIFTPGINCL